MKTKKNFREKIKDLILGVRRVFINDKKDIVTSKVFDNINLSFKDLSPYSELNTYKIILLLIFTSIILLLVLYFSYIDFKYNVKRNKPNSVVEPVKIVVKNPIDIDVPQDYENIIYTIKKGDILATILIDKLKIAKQDVFNCIEELKMVYDINDLRAGQKLYIKYKNNLVTYDDKITNSISLEELKILDNNNLKDVIISKTEDNIYKSRVNKIDLYTYYDKYIIKISNNMYTDAVKAGMPAEMVMSLINYYSFIIDFQRDIRKGDWFEVVFEGKYTRDGKKIKNGDIVYANLYTNNTNHKIYKFEYKNNLVYFDENGLSNQKSLLKTPINGARISSGYSNSRKHPVDGYNKAHKGIDFAAPIGTPFYAAGNGTIKKVVIGCKVGDRYCGGGFGNYILIEHNNLYSTEYAHLSQIAKNIRVGVKVKQRQVIGYVGITGLTTGPHLHYGVLYKGERINPNRIRTNPLIKLVGKDFLNFVEERDKINNLRLTAINQSISSF